MDPEVTFFIVVSVFTLSPGFILSGLYPQKKSSLNLSPLYLSKTGTQSSSVQPGYTVLSYITIAPFFITFPIISEAFSNGAKSGALNWFIGVGTVTINRSHNFKSSILLENLS